MAAGAARATEAGAAGSVPPGPLGEAVLDWLVERLWGQGVHRPTCKRLAVLTAGLLETTTVRRGDLTAAVGRLHLSDAQEPSIARRLERLLDDPQLDPARLLPLVQATVLPTLLADVCAAHAALAAAGGRAHRRWFPLQVIVDETSVRDQVHVLAAGLASQGIAVPLAVRTWPQNQALAPGEYWRHVHALLADVQAVLPPELRDHVVLVADRGYGTPRLVDLARALGWAWLLRVQSGVRVALRDGREVTAASLAPRPGTAAVTAGLLADQPDPAAPDAPPAADAPVAAFAAAGWRPCRLVALWAADAAEPWLLLTNLPANDHAGWTYARRWGFPAKPGLAGVPRWAIERLFLPWKSHGWDREALQRPTPARVGRLLTGMVLATLWVLAIAVAHAATLPATVADAMEPPSPRHQPYLPGCAPAPRDDRPWPAKQSCFTGGRKVLAATDLRSHTPPQRWIFPQWECPTWQAACKHPAA